jgi:DNA-binding transcriptional regulator GbsR (MarR family)
MSSEVLTDLEAKIKEKATALKTTDNKLEIITELDSLLTQRNKKSKILK